jgi:FGFR1 oncogene partner
LDTEGVLDKVRAQLRSKVFSAIEKTETGSRAPQVVENNKVDRILSSEDGQIALELIREFLEFYEVDYTLNVFVPECKLPAESRSKSYLGDKLSLHPGD